MYDPYPYLLKRPSEIAREQLSQTQDRHEYNDLADMVSALEILEAHADENLQKKYAVEALPAKISEMNEEHQADILLLKDEHALDLDDFRSAAATAEKIVKVVEKAFSKIGLDLPLDPADWHEATIMEAFATRMAELS